MPRTAGLHPQFEGTKKVTGAGVTNDPASAHARPFDNTGVVLEAGRVVTG